MCSSTQLPEPLTVEKRCVFIESILELMSDQSKMHLNVSTSAIKEAGTLWLKKSIFFLLKGDQMDDDKSRAV